MLWTLEKLRKTIFDWNMINFSGNTYLTDTERLKSAKVEKVLWLQKNYKKVILLLVYIWLLRKAFSSKIII